VNRALKTAVKRLLPKKIVTVLRRQASTVSQSADVEGLPEWEYLAAGWPAYSDAIKGWDEPSIARTQTSKWNSFLDSLSGPGPLGISHEAPAGSGRTNRWSHNVIMSYAYALALASRKMDKLAILDWGGGIGHYYPISKALLPDVEFEYHCKEVHVLAEAGRAILPDVKFVESDEECFGRQYDFVVAGSSLWCVENWKAILAQLIASTASYLYVTRMAFTDSGPSFVALQRPYAYGYQTEYPVWILSEIEFVAEAEAQGAQLVREFIFGEGPPIANAPARGTFKGFLFKRMPEGSFSA